VIRFAALTLFILFSTTLRADIVVLRNGDRLHGEIISESEEVVSLQRVNPEGNIRYVQKIQRIRIARVIRTDAPPTSQPTTVSPKRATATRPAGKPMSFTEKKTLLADAIRSWKHKNYSAADARLARLIHFATDKEWAVFSPIVEDQLEMTLADFAAEAQLRAAIAAAKGRPIELGRVPGGVVPALIPRLELAYADALNQPVVVKGKSGRSMTRPADPRRAHTIARWIDDPHDFDGSWSETRALAGHVRFAQSLLTERLRIEPTTTENVPVKVEIGRELGRLDILLTALTPDRPRPKLTPDTQPARLPADDTLKERRRQWLEQRRQAELQQINEESLKQEMELLPE
jgi:hypothetical protein